MNYKDIIKIELKKFIQQSPISKEINYSLLNGGKRFRSSLCYHIVDIFDTKLALAHSSSCALEMIHAYSLIHDDLPAMDDDDIRRNKPSSHKKFNEASAILAGDGLQALAFKIISEDSYLNCETKIKLLKVLTNASFNMVLGQKLDIVANKNISLVELKNINQLKTGELIKASIIMGGIVANVDDKINNILLNFAANLSKAYQVQDDTFDTKSVIEIGKTNKHKKTTFVDLLGLKKSIKYYQDLYKNALNDLQKIKNSDKLQILVESMKNRNF